MLHEKVTNQGDLEPRKKLADSCKSYLVESTENRCPHPMRRSPAYTSRLSVCLRSERLVNRNVPAYDHCVYRHCHASEQFQSGKKKRNRK